MKFQSLISLFNFRSLADRGNLSSAWLNSSQFNPLRIKYLDKKINKNLSFELKWKLDVCFLILGQNTFFTYWLIIKLNRKKLVQLLEFWFSEAIKIYFLELIRSCRRHYNCLIRIAGANAWGRCDFGFRKFIFESIKI